MELDNWDVIISSVVTCSLGGCVEISFLEDKLKRRMPHQESRKSSCHTRPVGAARLLCNSMCQKRDGSRALVYCETHSDVSLRLLAGTDCDCELELPWWNLGNLAATPLVEWNTA
ncbi:hypothetical protein AOLI_G00279920 [Acnodon oligacanthus]